ncbi:hypothetical protein ThidrDRAFT_4427 [Thiorhodococcus drewsii AZ1]|uniref:DUF5063 domain-containing protein n=1 Tax=Thiorhodococcus drewsii AZ1 TaxID=765913 RepID=G2E813_9GAMM|nr:DUF5063 domain-containing protein [Thiorhodococcus drewsii]EGV27756.1 hypothetical protein ThidrDRAFT_4427 [Thiorhodococcus drewsii AZ1]
MTQTARLLDFGVHREHREVAVLARRYCDLIDACSGDRDAWLLEVAELLPRLHAAIASISTLGRSFERPEFVDLDVRFDLFVRLRSLLADRDSYWLEFDGFGEGAEAMTGSLADDLTDIYYELQQGLSLFDQDPEHAIAAWSIGYDRHWGRHLIDAERHLASLSAQFQLGS